MLRSFESTRIELVVGSGGRALSQKSDIRLSDVVVGWLVGRSGGRRPPVVIVDPKLTKVLVMYDIRARSRARGAKSTLSA